MIRQKLAIGDTITFKAATRTSFKVAKRKVIEIDSNGRPMVRYAGWDNFIVHWREISAIEPKQEPSE